MTLNLPSSRTKWWPSRWGWLRQWLVLYPWQGRQALGSLSQGPISLAPRTSCSTESAPRSSRSCRGRASWPWCLRGATSGPISVVTPGGTAVSAEPFTVVFPPTLTGFTPATGPAGTRVTLTGTHFLGATYVRFNGVRAVEFAVLSGTRIEAVVPSGATSGPISVVTPGGTAVSAEPFTVVPPPTLTGFTPATGPAGTRVTLTGTHFLGATDVRFNGVRAVEFEVVSGTSIEAVVPSGATSGPIGLVTSGGNSGERRPLHGNDWFPEPVVCAHRSAISGTNTGILLHFRDDSHQPGIDDSGDPLHL